MTRLTRICRHAGVLLLTLAIILSGSPAGLLAQQAAVAPELLAYPTLILFNGKVLTVDDQFTIAEAVAVRDGRVLAVGSTANIKRLAGPDTRLIDLAGRSHRSRRKRLHLS